MFKIEGVSSVKECSLEQKLEKRLAGYRAKIKVVKTIETAISRQFLVELGTGVRISKLQSLQEEISLVLGSKYGVRIFAIHEQGVVAIEMPLDQRVSKSFSEVVQNNTALTESEMNIPLLFGIDANGHDYFVDLEDLPHLLVAGQTGSGKSVFLRAIINSIGITAAVRDISLLLIDPKSVEFTPYNSMSNMLTDAIGDINEAIEALDWLITRMEKRFKLLAKYECSNIREFNKKYKQKIAPIVVVIDEFADLIMQEKAIATYIIRLAQKGRAAGIHLIIATQRPSSKIIDGLIKANFAARVAFRMASGVDSRIVLEQPGAENLLGKGDMLFSHGANLVRLQGVYASNEDIKPIPIAA